MRNIVIGTAGHIDHGKTTLVKYLTGKDTDTLPEEKKRGITIDLGFSFLDISDDRKIGIVDVPGHEKFIKNMTAGAAGIDYIILTVACDDGVMPQTEEHFNIIRFLGIKHGIIVLTKTDLVNDEQKEIVKKQIKNLVKNSFLEKSEILETSLKNKKSYENLKDFLIKDLEKIIINEHEENSFRMSADRSFTVKGFGTVVTGTVSQGKVSIDDFVYIHPSNLKGRVKGIENHGTKLKTIEVGNRCALNLAGIEKSQIKRGDILSSSSNVVSSKIIDVSFELLKGNSIKNNQRIRAYFGTREIIGRIKIFENDYIESSGKYFAQLHLEEEAAVLYNELGIIRNYSPLKTLGGIKVLNILGEKTKRNNKEYIQNLENLDSNYFIKDDKEKAILLKEILENFHKENCFQRGILRAELKNRYFSNMSYKEFKELIDTNIKENEIKIEKIFEKEYISLKNFKIKLSKEQKELKEKIFKIYKENGLVPEKKSVIEKNFSEKEKFREVHNYLYEEGMIIFLKEDYYILKGFLKEAEKKVTEYLKENKKITISDFRKLLDINRQSALLILEKFDEISVTQRIEDYRILK